MDEDALKIWAARPDTCRCCLSAQGTWDISLSRVSELGVKEVYSDILQECFGIILSDTGAGKLACEMCVVRLREADAFKKQVLHVEEVFLQFLQESMKEADIKAEPDPSFYPEGGGFDTFSDDDHKNFFNEDPIKTELDQEKIKKKQVKGTQSKNKKLKSKIKKTELKEKKAKKFKLRTDSNKDQNLEDATCDIQGHVIGDVMEVLAPQKKQRIRLKLRNGVLKAPKFTTKMSAESYVDNRQLRSNITLILKNSTVLPFKFRGQKFYCFYCQQYFFQYNELKQHTITNHSNLTEDDILSALKLPKSLINADVSEIKCQLCDKNIKNIEELIGHLVSTHKKLYFESDRLRPSHGILGFDMSSEKYKCVICRLEFDFFKCLTAHMNVHSSDFICPTCGKSFVSDVRLQGHVMRNHNITDDDKTCKQCLKKFATIGRKEYHVRTVHSGVKLKCSECDMEFTHRQHRLKHLAEVHNFELPKYQCNICMKEFSNRGCLLTHTQTVHVKDKAYSCEICGKSYFRRYVWKRHLKGHYDKT